VSQPIAFVLLEAAATPDMPLLVEAMRQRHAELPWEIEQSAQGGALPFIRCGGTLVVVMHVGAALPHDANLWRRAAMTWPPAPQVAESHRAHLIVSVMGEGTNKLESARIVTAVVGGLVATVPGSCAVVWGARVARSAQLWLETSRTTFAPYPNYPFTLWIDVVPFRSNPSSVGAFTVGLAAFVSREIEFELPGFSGAALIQRVAGLAVFLIQRGDLVADGDTIGASEAERIKVYHRTSRFNASPVLAVGNQPPPPGSSKSYPIISPAIARDHPLLAMLTRVGLYDPTGADNQVQLAPEIYDSELRLESYDRGVTGWLSNILTSDPYIRADEQARTSLARGDLESAKSALRPFAESIRQFQTTAREAMTQGRLFMFSPKQQLSKPL
jgi:hypothetical protein